MKRVRVVYMRSLQQQRHDKEQTVPQMFGNFTIQQPGTGVYVWTISHFQKNESGPCEMTDSELSWFSSVPFGNFWVVTMYSG